MAKVKVVGTGLDQNLNGTNFNNTASETIFQFGRFAITSNFGGRIPINYTNTLSSFVLPITLESLGVNDTQSAVLYEYQTNVVLNLDKSNLNTYVRFGSTYEFFRVSIQEIILKYPGSLFANSNTMPGGNTSVYDFYYDVVNDVSTFKVSSAYIDNKFGLVFNQGNVSKPDNMELRNLNISYEKYTVWSKYNPDNSYYVIGFTGDTNGVPYIRVKTFGNPFPFNSGATTGSFDFHIKPSNFIFEEFRALLTNYEQYIVAQREGTSGFQFKINDPTLLDDGNIVYANTTKLWTTSDGYNIDFTNSSYQKFLDSMLTIGAKYDSVKTDLIARFLTPVSIKTYDLTEQGKMTKLLRVYGWEFDQMRKFIDSLVNINTVTYDKINNIPDQLVSNLARTFGWDYFTLVNEGELVNSFLTIEDTERNLNTDLLPAEINIELWRRILLNTNYFWKSKGTREAIKAMFLLIGIPEPFINITEYVYTVAGKIDPRQVTLKATDFPSNSLPYDNSGYPKAPLETNSFYFQISGNTDSGQAYLNAFRQAGFDLRQTPDNKKSWIQAGAVTRQHYSTPQYTQEDSKLVINTKEVDVALDTARGIEYDVYNYIQKDFAANSSGYTLPFSYVNISLGVSASQATFQIPDKTQGDFEVRYNGILLNAPKTGNTSGITYQADYIINYGANTFTLTGDTGAMFAINSGNRRDVIQATYIYSGSTSRPVTGITVDYIVSRVNANLTGTYIPLPSYPRGDVQVTINGIALTKGTPQFIADYILDPANSTGGSNNIIIQNPEVISYLVDNPTVQVAYVKVVGSNEINARSEVVRVDSFNSSKIYFNSGANKFVYKLNYKLNDVSEVKILVDGIALEPGMDYSLNSQNPYEIFLPGGLNYGSIISAYYLVALSTYFNPIVDDNLGVGDISQLSFLEFIELLQRRLINARNRKTISDFKGGWYPALLNVYIQYLKRGLLPYNDPLHSNGYTFENLYPFLSKYNAFFNRFVDELLSATIILRQGGLLIRNTVFCKQKFMYKRGVNLYSNISPLIDKRGNQMTQYLGDDGSTFLINQGDAPPAATIPVVTTNEITSILITTATGGGNVTSDGGSAVTSRGICWSTSPSPTTGNSKTFNGLGTGAFTSLLTLLVGSTTYYVRAYATNGVGIAYGNEVTFITDAVPIIPSIQTKQGSATFNSIDSTGGESIVSYALIQYYAMQYRTGTTGTWSLFPTSPLSGPLAVDNFATSITGLLPSTLYTYRAYMVVAGNPYYGNVRQITTAAIPLFVPTVSGGTAYLSPFCMSQWVVPYPNKVTDKGYPTTISEYGVLYTQIPAYGTPSTLCYENYPATVCKKSCTGDIAVNIKYIQPIPWSSVNTITGLTQNTTVYYRAYARNSAGSGYGAVKTIQTAASKQINLYKCCLGGANGSHNTNNTFNLCSSPPMISGDCYCICLRFPIGLSPSLFGSGSFASVALSCAGCSSPWTSLCSACIANVACNNASVSIIMKYGDVLAFPQWTCATTLGCGGANVCVCIASITSINTSTSLFTIGTTCSNSCSYTG